MSFHLILFLAFGAVCVGGAVNLLAQRHPINSALSLIAVMAALAGEYLLLGAEFVAAVQVIVYAGAIMVLFVFVIMLLNAAEEEETRGSRVAFLLGVPGVLTGSVLTAWVVDVYKRQVHCEIRVADHEVLQARELRMVHPLPRRHGLAGEDVDAFSSRRRR